MKKNIIEKLKDEFLERNSGIRKRIVVCAGTGCVANGALKVFNAITNAVKELNANADVLEDNTQVVAALAAPTSVAVALAQVAQVAAAS